MASDALRLPLNPCRPSRGGNSGVNPDPFAADNRDAGPPPATGEEHADQDLAGRAERRPIGRRRPVGGLRPVRRPPPDLFSSDPAGRDLKGDSLRGGAALVSAELASHAVNLVSIAVMARLLTPEDFGLIAMVAAAVGLLSVLKDAGLSMAIVQRETIEEAQVSVLFWVNTALSAALALAAVALAPAVAWFYGEPRLSAVTTALGAGLVLGGLTAQHSALLRRQMRFRAIAAAELGALTLSTIAAIAAALAGFGYWALVVRALATPLLRLIAIWALLPWRPGRPRRAAGTGGMLRFGGYLTGFRLVNFAGHNVDDVLVGRFLGSVDLGVYSKAYGLLMLPLRMVNRPLTNVAVPAMSRLQSQPERLRSYYYKGVGLVATLSFPVVAFVAATSESLVLTVLGEQWTAVIDVFRILAIPAFIAATNVATGWVFVSLGHVERQMWAGVANTAVGVIAVAIGLRWGLQGVAWALVASALVRRLPTLLYCYHGTPFRLATLGRTLAPAAFAAIVAGAFTRWVHGEIVAAGAWPWVALLASAPAFASAYVLGLAGPPGGRRRMAETLALVQALRPRPAEAAG